MIGIRNNPNKWAAYSMNQGYLWHQGRIMLPKNSSLIPDILLEFHDYILGGHSRFASTCYRIIVACILCQRNKTNYLKLVRLLQPLPILDLIWD